MVPSIHETDGKTASREKEMKRDVKVAENHDERRETTLFSFQTDPHCSHYSYTFIQDD